MSDLRFVVCSGHCWIFSANMFTARKKIAKEKGAEPDDFEESVAQVRETDCDLWQLKVLMFGERIV